jgi:hypothetical protein
MGRDRFVCVCVLSIFRQGVHRGGGWGRASKQGDEIKCACSCY